MPNSSLPAESLGLIFKNEFLDAMLLVVSILFLWAAYLRKPSRRHLHSHPRHHWRNPKPASTHEPEEKHAGGFFGKRRQRKRRKRRLNPTLAETGGLPPVRASDSEENAKD